LTGPGCTAPIGANGNTISQHPCQQCAHRRAVAAWETAAAGVAAARELRQRGVRQRGVRQRGTAAVGRAAA
jgi:hypothetical protein